jgi:Bacteriophage baseplate protein W
MVNESGSHLAFPFRVSQKGSMEQISSVEEHIKQELIQLVLTDLGERLFLPEFGGRARGFIFKNVDAATSSIAKSTLMQAISKWLGHRLIIEDLEVAVEEEKLNIGIKYRVAGTEDTREIMFQHKGE